MEQKELFRKAALDKLASPEQLDVLMEVTSPKGWVALGTVGATLLAVLVWSVFGSIPTRVQGQGILIRGGALREVKAGAEGELVELDVRLDESVTQNQLLGRIAVPSLEEKTKSAAQKVTGLEAEYESALVEDEATIDANKADVARTMVELQKVSEELRNKKRSYEKGLITRSSLLSFERDKITLEASLTRLNGNIRQLEQKLRQRKLELDAARREMEELQSTGERGATLSATVAGRVIELKKAVGDRVTAGEVVALLEPFTGEMEPIVFVPSTQGKRIRPGMEAQISPSTVKTEEYGYMKGTVAYVGEYPVTPEAAAAVVANESLVRELLGNTAKIQLRASILPRPETPTGYAWSSSNGPPFKIASGTRVTISVIVDRRRPITFVLPLIKANLGAS